MCLIDGEYLIRISEPTTTDCDPREESLHLGKSIRISLEKY